MRDIGAGVLVLLGELNEKSVDTVLSLDHHIVGIIASTLGAVAYKSTLVPVDAVGGIIHNEVYAVFASCVEDVDAVEVCNLRIAGYLCNVALEGLAPGLALVLADKAGEVILVVYVIAVEHEASVGTEHKIAVCVPHGIEGELGEYLKALAVIIRHYDLIEETFLVAGKALVGGVAELENVDPSVAVGGIVYSASFVMNFYRLGPSLAVIVAQEADGSSIWLKASADASETEEDDGAVVADDCFFTAYFIYAVEKAFPRIIENFWLAPGETSVVGVFIFHPAVHGVSEIFAAVFARAVGIEGNESAVLAFDHGVSEMTASALFGVIYQKAFVYEGDLGIILFKYLFGSDVHRFFSL